MSKESEELEAFQKELQAVLEKYKKIIYAAPTWVLNEGHWEISSEIKWADKPEKKDEPTPEA